ncbi:hypothetical protein [Streptomyces filamentosus]|uniref:hypothetical protein n=1 Tax=Streptomyces filamentosus TaxID=67294 RepID=UPI0033F48EF2
MPTLSNTIAALADLRKHAEVALLERYVTGDLDTDVVTYTAVNLLNSATAREELLGAADRVLGKLAKTLPDAEQHFTLRLVIDGVEYISLLGFHSGDLPPEVTIDAGARFLLLLAATLAQGAEGSLVARSMPDESAIDEVRAWVATPAGLTPLTGTQVLVAFCTDPKTGEAIAPEPDTAYLGGFPLA